MATRSLCLALSLAFAQGSPHAQSEGRDFVIRWADRLLFGTDVLMSGQEIPQFALYDSLDLPEDVQYKIYRGNAIRILKLPKDQ